MVASVPAAVEPSASVVLVGAEAVSDIDATAIETVSRVDGVELARAFPSVRVAVEAFEQHTPPDDPGGPDDSRGDDPSADDAHEPMVV